MPANWQKQQQKTAAASRFSPISCSQFAMMVMVMMQDPLLQTAEPYLVKLCLVRQLRPQPRALLLSMWRWVQLGLPQVMWRCSS
jgi:hypothetical protein